MPREKDPFWQHVTPLNESNSKWRCNFCQQENSGTATRIKAHLAGIARFGIKGCEKVGDDVKAEARDRLMPQKVMDSSDKSVSEEGILGNVRAAPTSQSHGSNVEGGTNLQFPLGASAQASLSLNDRITDTPSNQPLRRCNEECGTETSSFHLRESMDTDAATHEDSQVLEGGANMAGPSSSQASVPPQHQSVPQQCIDHETRSAEQNPTIVACHLLDLMDMDPCITSSSQAPNNAPPPIPPCGTGLIIPSLSLELDMNEDAPMTSHQNTGNDIEGSRDLKRKLELLYSKEASIRDELLFAESLSLWKLSAEVANWLADVEKLRNNFCSIETASEDCLPSHQEADKLTRGVEDLMRQGKGLFEARETKVGKLLKEKMVGEAFQRNTTEVLEFLVGNEISQLGIYGMGGVGKTTIMVYVHNRLLEEANYGNVLWITVSQDFNTRRLQDDLWKGLGLGIIQEWDLRKRAAILSDCLTRRGKYTIILDDLWECVDLEEVGIPIKADGVKLVLSTRSFDVCCQMHCEKKIKIKPLTHIEAQSLFLEELGFDLNLETKCVVESIVKECAGLPLAIITMARSMRGVTDVFEWRDCLEKLEESSMWQTDMEKKVLMNLKFSYDRLGNPEVQQCFLSCALYPKDELIDKFELIEFFIDQGLIGRLNMRGKQYDRGLTILNKLENVCLLEYDRDKIKMHNMIRHMALHIMSATSIVRAGKCFRMIPSEEYWTDALEKVSLMENDIRDFPLSMSPYCPKLSTCLFNRTFSKGAFISDSFFQQLWGLKVLNLSGCELRVLPNSISNLVNLRALLLRECGELCQILCLGKLQSLRKLDIYGCVCLQALDGLGKLVNLRYLDLTKTKIKKLARGKLAGMLNLQYLKMEEANVEDITKLRALEVLECYLEDVDCFNKFVSVIKQINHHYYELKVDQGRPMFSVKVSGDARFGDYERRVFILDWTDAILSVGGESTGFCILIPQDVQKLIWVNCDKTTILPAVGHLENLESLNIEKWERLRVLCGETNIHDSPAPTPTPPLFQNLRVLEILQCPKLTYLIGHGSKFFFPYLGEIRLSDCEEIEGIIASATSPPALPLVFPSLEEIYVVRCDKMKRLPESEWLTHFPKLKSIPLHLCANMEEIKWGAQAESQCLPSNMDVCPNSQYSSSLFDCDYVILRTFLLLSWKVRKSGRC